MAVEIDFVGQTSDVDRMGFLQTLNELKFDVLFDNCPFTVKIINQHINCQLNTQLQFRLMASHIINRQIVSILSNYLYNHPLKMPNSSQNQPQPSQYPSIHKPLDYYMRNYFNARKYLGSTERSSISDKVYNMVRYEYLLSHVIRSKPFDIEKPRAFNDQVREQIEYKLRTLFSSEFYNAMDNQSLPKYNQQPFQISKSLAEQTVEIWVFRLFKELSVSLMKEDQMYEEKSIIDKKHKYDLGNQDEAYKVSYIMNSKAPLTIRVNPLKTTKHDLIGNLQKKLKLRLQKCQYAPFGFKIVAPKNINLLETEQFLKGGFEIQDQGSQLAALRAQIKPGDLVLDYCGGSGGKSLAIAHLLQGKGQIFVHEPREVALGKAKKRFNRAGINNVQFHSNEESLSKIVTGKIDWLIIDAPCSGVGTLRRNPDIKLKFTNDWVKKNVILQQQIVHKALKFLKKNGRMLYITCSLLREQNEEQISHFVKNYNLEVVDDEIMKILPQKDGSDGFFAVVLKKTH